MLDVLSDDDNFADNVYIKYIYKITVCEMDRMTNRVRSTNLPSFRIVYVVVGWAVRDDETPTGKQQQQQKKIN